MFISKLRLGLSVLVLVVLAVGFAAGTKSVKASSGITVTKIHAPNPSGGDVVLKIDDDEAATVCYVRPGTGISCVKK